MTSGTTFALGALSPPADDDKRGYTNPIKKSRGIPGRIYGDVQKTRHAILAPNNEHKVFAVKGNGAYSRTDGDYAGELLPRILGATTELRPQPPRIGGDREGKPHCLRRDFVVASLFLWVSMPFSSVFLRGRRVSARVPCGPGPAPQVFSSPLVSPWQPGTAVRRLPFGVCLPRTHRWRKTPKDLRTADAPAANEISRSLAATEKVSLAQMGKMDIKLFP